MSDEENEQPKKKSKLGCFVFIIIWIIIAIVYNCINPSPDAASRSRIDGATKAINEWNQTATPAQKRAVENFGN